MPQEPQRLAATCKGYSKNTSKQTVRLNRLEAQYHKQKQLMDETQRQTQEIQCLHELLADGICQQRLLYELLVPLHQQWLRNDHSFASISSWCAADDRGRERVELLDTVAGCNPMVAALLKATPQQVREAAALTLQELISMHTQVFRELLVLVELLSPSRYRGEEVREDGGGQEADMQVEDTDTPGREATPAAAAVGTAASHEAAETVASACSTQAAAAARQIEMPHGLLGLPDIERVTASAADEQAAALAAAAAAEERLSQLIGEYHLLGGLLILHNPGVVMQACCYNLSTGQPCVAPLRHFVHAAERIGLSAQQLELLRLMLQQYNRSICLLLQEGRQLLRLVEHSAGVQVVAAMAETQGALGGGAGAAAASAAGDGAGGGWGFSKDRLNPPAHKAKQQDDRAVCDTSCNDQQQEQGQEQGQQQQPQDKSLSAAAADSVGCGLGAEGIARRLHKHVAARMNVTQLMSFWVGNVMSTRQMATSIVASWPYYPMAPALAEAASTLLPPPTPQRVPPPSKGTTTGGCCGCAADRPADARMGVGAEQHMQWRRRGMCAELTWLLEHQHASTAS